MTEQEHIEAVKQDDIQPVKQEDVEPMKKRPSLRLSRGRLTELGVVIFGVLIALLLENLVQEIRWRGEAADLEQLFRADLVADIGFAVERRAVDPCLARRLAALAHEGDRPGGVYRPQPYVTSLENVAGNLMPVAYRAPYRILRMASFERGIGSEAAKRMPQERLLKYAEAFGYIAALRDAQAQEDAAQAALQPLALGFPQFDAQVRAGVLRDIALAENARARMSLLSLRVIEQVRALGVEPDAEWLRSILAAQRQGRGACVIAIPMPPQPNANPNARR